MQAKVLERKILNFFKVPTVVTNQGEEAEKLLKERRSLWISAISRDDLTEQIIANDPVTQEKEQKVGTDLTLTGMFRGTSLRTKAI